MKDWMEKIAGEGRTINYTVQEVEKQMKMMIEGWVWPRDLSKDAGIVSVRRTESCRIKDGREMGWDETRREA